MKTILRDILGTAVLAVVIFLLLQATVQVSVINGHSMEPDLHNGQRLIVNKAAYFFDQPERGDIIIFHPPDNPRVEYIKRIIGKPGDVVEIKKGVVYINGETLPETYVKEPPHYTLSQTEIPATNYFVLGDNRNNSNDSHNGWTVPRENIIGKAWLSIWPPPEWGLAPNYSFDQQMADPTS